jgi:hypothetical protein
MNKALHVCYNPHIVQFPCIKAIQNAFEHNRCAAYAATHSCEVRPQLTAKLLLPARTLHAKNKQQSHICTAQQHPLHILRCTHCEYQLVDCSPVDSIHQSPKKQKAAYHTSRLCTPMQVCVHVSHAWHGTAMCLCPTPIPNKTPTTCVLLAGMAAPQV